jgi:hypothetical protein
MRTNLLNQRDYEIAVTETSLFLVDKNVSIRIIAILSLQWSHCARAFEKIKDILKSEAYVVINIIMMTSDTKMLNTLYHYNRHNMNDELVSKKKFL